MLIAVAVDCLVSTHSRPKAAGLNAWAVTGLLMFQLTAARRRLVVRAVARLAVVKFQLTAARRRLENA